MGLFAGLAPAPEGAFVSQLNAGANRQITTAAPYRQPSWGQRDSLRRAAVRNGRFGRCRSRLGRLGRGPCERASGPLEGPLTVRHRWLREE